ncbi:MAG: hypothetical protein J6M91_09340 [Methanobrevibacter sp.]|nr:hypothetical protein [Methanobrevibacter sp.]
MSSDTNVIGNSSSIFKTIGLMIAGYLIPLAVAHGVNFHGQETQIIQALGVIIGLGLSYIDMKYANSYFKRTITLEDYIQYGEKHFNLTQINEECNCDCEECTCENKGDENAGT